MVHSECEFNAITEFLREIHSLKGSHPGIENNSPTHCSQMVVSFETNVLHMQSNEHRYYTEIV